MSSQNHFIEIAYKMDSKKMTSQWKIHMPTVMCSSIKITKSLHTKYTQSVTFGNWISRKRRRKVLPFAVYFEFSFCESRIKFAAISFKKQTKFLVLHKRIAMDSLSFDDEDVELFPTSRGTKRASEECVSLWHFFYVINAIVKYHGWKINFFRVIWFFSFFLSKCWISGWVEKRTVEKWLIFQRISFSVYLRKREN